MLTLHPPRVNHWPSALKSAAALQGTLIPTGPGYRAAAWPDTPAARCAALGALLTPRFAAAELTAAWVWGECETLPSPVSFTTRRGRVPPLLDISGVSLREFALTDDDLVYVGEFAVTSPSRTVFDIVRLLPSVTGAHSRICRRLLARAPGNWEAVFTRAARSSNADRARVHHWLREMTPRDDS